MLSALHPHPAGHCQFGATEPDWPGGPALDSCINGAECMLSALHPYPAGYCQSRATEPNWPGRPALDSCTGFECCGLLCKPDGNDSWRRGGCGVLCSAGCGAYEGRGSD